MYLDKINLDGRLAFITGGGRGIGLCTAQAFLEAGARVVVADIDPAVLDQGISTLVKAGYEAHGVVLDVTSSDATAAAAQEVTTRYGFVDIVVANAGVAWPDTPAEDMPDAVWRRSLDVNMSGTFWTCRAFAKPMLQKGRGSIVTLGSISGLIANRPQRHSHYNAAKAGIHHLTRSLAGEWAERGVRVNCVAPTYVDTEMSRRGFTDDSLFPVWMDNTPMRRVAQPDEVASAILFLASDAASAITGAVLNVDCGYTVW